MSEQNLLTPRLVGRRFDELRLLKDGWLEDAGKAPSKEGLDWLEEAFSLHYPDEAVLPYLYPTPEGDIRAEWSNERVEISLDIELASREGVWHALDVETDAAETLDLRLGEEGDWAGLVERLRDRLGGAA